MPVAMKTGNVQIDSRMIFKRLRADLVIGVKSIFLCH